MELLKYLQPQLPQPPLQEGESEGEALLPREREIMKHPFPYRLREIEKERSSPEYGNC